MKERLTLEEVIRRHKEAFARKDLWRSVYEEAYEYGLPQRNMYQGYYEGNVPGQGKMNRVFDSTAIDSTQKFANKIQSGLFPHIKNGVVLRQAMIFLQRAETRFKKNLTNILTKCLQLCDKAILIWLWVSFY